MTRKEYILKLLSNGCIFSCATICKHIKKDFSNNGSQSKYLSGSISSLLRKMVRNKELMYSKESGTRGGWTYMLYDENKIWYEYCKNCNHAIEINKWICGSCGTYQRKKL